MKELTPLKAIHKFCVNCSGSQKKVKLCNNPECFLFLFRLGKDPHRKGKGRKGGNPNF